MTDFEYDCMVKKRTARSASHKKSGAKSTRCSLPSDHLTNKQWKERCGEVMSYKLGSPMDWADFKNMPKDIQSEYITNLQSKYGVNAGDLGEMFGVKSVTVRRYCETNGLNVKFRKGVAMTGDQRAMWDVFLHGSDAAEVPAEPAEEEIHVEDIMPPDEFFRDVDDEELLAESTFPLEALAKPETMTMTEVNLSFEGKIDIDSIANSLRVILGADPVGYLDVTFRRG